MAKPFGKKVNDWLRQNCTQEYLDYFKRHFVQIGNSRFGQNGSNEPILVIKGGQPGENGTWCTDYRIAMRFAQWLSIEFSILVDELLVRIAQGGCLFGDDGMLEFAGKRWISRAEYCKSLGRPINSFNGLKAHYPNDFLFYAGKWYISLALFNMKEVQTHFENIRTEIRANNDATQLAIPFEG